MQEIRNSDANWNNQSQQEKEYYLDEYMAKNLHVLSANTLNQTEPKGETSHPVGKFAAIVPINNNYEMLLLLRQMMNGFGVLLTM